MLMWPISTRVNKPRTTTIVEPKRQNESQAEAIMLPDYERHFLAHQRVAYLATADSRAVPHVVPVCFAIFEDTLYITIDEKPKRHSGLCAEAPENIAENPAVAVVVDRYDEDWARLGWVMLHGRAEILTEGTEHQQAQALLRSRYPQLGAMQIAQYPVIAVRIERATSWGNLSVARECRGHSFQLR